MANERQIENKLQALDNVITKPVRIKPIKENATSGLYRKKTQRTIPQIKDNSSDLKKADALVRTAFGDTVIKDQSVRLSAARNTPSGLEGIPSTGNIRVSAPKSGGTEKTKSGVPISPAAFASPTSGRSKLSIQESILSRMEQFQLTQVKAYMAKDLSLSYQRTIMGKDTLTLLKTLADVIETKLEAIKINTSVSEKKKETIIQGLKATAFKEIVHGGVTSLLKPYKESLARIAQDRIIKPIASSVHNYAKNSQLAGVYNKWYNHASKFIEAPKSNKPHATIDDDGLIHWSFEKPPVGKTPVNHGHTAGHTATLKVPDGLKDIQKRILDATTQIATASKDLLHSSRINEQVAQVTKTAQKAATAASSKIGDLIGKKNQFLSGIGNSVSNINTTAIKTGAVNAFGQMKDSIHNIVNRAAQSGITHAVAQHGNNVLNGAKATAAQAASQINLKSITDAIKNSMSDGYSKLTNMFHELNKNKQSEKKLAREPKHSVEGSGSVHDELVKFHNSFLDWSNRYDRDTAETFELLRALHSGGPAPKGNKKGGGIVGMGFGLAHKVVGTYGKIMGAYVKGITGVAKHTANLIFSKGHAPFVDVYRKDRPGQPLVTKEQFASGLLYGNGKPVMDIRDIYRHGPVYDPVTGNQVITLDDLHAGLVDPHGKEIMKLSGGVSLGGAALKLGTFGIKTAASVALKGTGMYFNFLGTATKAIFGGKKHTPFIDVYRKGQKGQPLVKARQFYDGLVFNDGKPVIDVSKINRPVIDPKTGNELISQADLDAGLVDPYGRNISKHQVGGGGLAHAALNLGMFGIKTAGGVGKALLSNNPLWAMYSGMFGLGLKGIGAAGKGASELIARIFGKGGTGINKKDVQELITKRLDEIIHILKKCRCPDGSTPPTGGSGSPLRAGSFAAQQAAKAAGGSSNSTSATLAALGTLGGGHDQHGGGQENTSGEHDGGLSTTDLLEYEAGGGIASWVGKALAKKFPILGKIARLPGRALGKATSGIGRGLLGAGKFVGKKGLALAGAALPAGWVAANALRSSAPAAAATAAPVINTAATAARTGGTVLQDATKVAPAVTTAAQGAAGLVAKDATDSAVKLGEKEAAKLAEEETAKLVAKTVGKSIGKSILKKIPGVSILAGLGFAAGRLWDGDILGAAGELASGVVGTVPIVGTAASIGIDGWLAYRDVTNNSAAPTAASQLMDIRMKAYGAPNDTMDAVTALESKIYSKSMVGKKPLDADDYKQAAEAFNLDANNAAQIKYFKSWVDNRFAKIFSVYALELVTIGHTEYGSESRLKAEQISDIIDDFRKKTANIVGTYSYLAPTIQAYKSAQSAADRNAPTVPPPPSGSSGSTAADAARNAAGAMAGAASGAVLGTSIGNSIPGPSSGDNGSSNTIPPRTDSVNNQIQLSTPAPGIPDTPDIAGPATSPPTVTSPSQIQAKGAPQFGNNPNTAVGSPRSSTGLVMTPQGVSGPHVGSPSSITGPTAPPVNISPSQIVSPSTLAPKSGAANQNISTPPAGGNVLQFATPGKGKKGSSKNWTPAPPVAAPLANTSSGSTGPRSKAQAKAEAAAQSSAKTQHLVNYFQSQGWTREQASGIVANLVTESNLRPDVVGDRGAAYGIGQWHSDRQAQFKAVFGKDIKGATLEEQAAFVQWELTNTESAAGKKLATAKTAQEAGAVVSAHYERPADVAGNQAIRGSLANKISGEPADKTPTTFASGPAAPVTPPVSKQTPGVPTVPTVSSPSQIQDKDGGSTGHTASGSVPALTPSGTKPAPTGPTVTSPDKLVASRAANSATGATPPGQAAAAKMAPNLNTAPAPQLPSGKIKYGSGKGEVADSGVINSITAAAAKVGVSPAALLAIAHNESAFKADAKATTSSAAGLFQFIDSTQVDTFAKYGKEVSPELWNKLPKDKNGNVVLPKDSKGRVDIHKLPPDVLQPILDLKKNPEAAGILGAHLYKDTNDQLSKAIGRPTSIGDNYMGHFLGVGGAAPFLKAMDKNPNAIPPNPGANDSVYFKKGADGKPDHNQPRTYKEVYDLMTNRVNENIGNKLLSSVNANLPGDDKLKPDVSPSKDKAKQDGSLANIVKPPPGANDNASSGTPNVSKSTDTTSPGKTDSSSGTSSTAGSSSSPPATDSSGSQTPATPSSATPTPPTGTTATPSTSSTPTPTSGSPAPNTPAHAGHHRHRQAMSPAGPSRTSSQPIANLNTAPAVPSQAITPTTSTMAPLPQTIAKPPTVLSPGSVPVPPSPTLPPMLQPPGKELVPHLENMNTGMEKLVKLMHGAFGEKGAFHDMHNTLKQNLAKPTSNVVHAPVTTNVAKPDDKKNNKNDTCNNTGIDLDKQRTKRYSA